MLTPSEVDLAKGRAFLQGWLDSREARRAQLETWRMERYNETLVPAFQSGEYNAVPFDYEGALFDAEAEIARLRVEIEEWRARWDLEFPSAENMFAPEAERPRSGPEFYDPRVNMTPEERAALAPEAEHADIG